MAFIADSDSPRISASNAFHSCDPENGNKKMRKYLEALCRRRFEFHWRRPFIARDKKSRCGGRKRRKRQKSEKVNGMERLLVWQHSDSKLGKKIDQE